MMTLVDTFGHRVRGEGEPEPPASLLEPHTDGPGGFRLERPRLQVWRYRHRPDPSLSCAPGETWLAKGGGADPRCGIRAPPATRRNDSSSEEF
jgi:hypothetical protein